MFRVLKPCGVLGFLLVWVCATAQAAEHTVRIVSDHQNLRMYYDPKVLVIQPGDSVTWVNVHNEEHNVVTFPDGFPKGASFFRSPIMTKAGETWKHTFPKAGSYEYHCVPHLPMGMHGLVIVGQPSANEDYHVPSAEEVAEYRDMMLRWFEEDEIEYPSRENRDSAALKLGHSTALQP